MQSLLCYAFPLSFFQLIVTQIFNPVEYFMWLYLNPASQLLPLRKGFMRSQKEKNAV